MKKNLRRTRRASKTYTEANSPGAMSFKKQIDTRHIEHDSIMLDNGKTVSKIGAIADTTADSILENFLPYLGWTWSCNCNSTTGSCTCTITNTGGGSGGGGDTISDVETSLTGTLLTTSVTTDLGTHSDSVDLSSLSGGGTSGEPLYTADKPGIALNSTEDTVGGIVNLNNGDGSVIPIYATVTIDDALSNKADVATLSDYVLDSTYQSEIATKLSTTDFNASQAIQDGRLTNVEEGVTTLQTQLSAVILEQSNNGPVALSTTPTSILSFPAITNAGKYNGAMRATWTGSGTRDITATIYINGSPTSRTTTQSITSNQTTSLFTATPLDLVEGDIVEVYASSTTGSVSAIAGALQLVLSNGTIDLSEYVTNASYIPEQEAQDTRISQLQLDVSDLGTGLSNNTSAISANTTAIADLQSMSVESINFFTYFKANSVDNLSVSGYLTSGKIFKSDLELIGTTQGDSYGVVKNATLFGSFIMNQTSTGLNYFAPCFDITQVSTVAGIYFCKVLNVETGEFVGYINVPFNGINPVVGALFITVTDAVIVGDLEFQGAYLKPINEGKYAVDFQLYITSIEYV